MLTTCKNADGAQQIVGDRCAEHPRRIRPELPRQHVRQGSVDEIAEGGFDDCVLVVSDIGIDHRDGGVGEGRMISPHREQSVGVVSVFDAARDQAGGDRSLGRSESCVSGFGGLGVGDLGSGVRVTHGTGIFHRIHASS